MRRGRHAPLGYRVLARVVGVLVRLLRWRIDARGFHHVPEHGGAVLTWNHTSHVDFAATALPLWQESRRWVRLLALQDLWERPVLGRLLRLARCVPVERSSVDGGGDALAHAVAALQGDQLVMVAPEGTISASVHLLPFRTGAVRRARAAGVPVIPTASWGSHRFATTGRAPSPRRAWRLPVVVRVGEPLHVGPDDDPHEATELLRQRTRALLDEARADHPGAAPAGGSGGGGAR